MHQCPDERGSSYDSQRKLLPTHLSGTAARAASWQGLAIASQAALQLLSLAILARLISPREFGLLAVASTVNSLTLLLADSGFGSALIQRREGQLSPLHIRVAFTVTIGLGVLSGAGLYIAAPGLAHYLRMETASDLLRLMSVNVPLLLFGSISQSLLQRSMRFRELFFVNVGSYLFVYFPTAVIMAFAGSGAWALACATLAQTAANALGTFAAAPHSLKPSVARQPLKELMRFGAGMTLSRVFNTCAEQMDILVIGRLLGADALGLYERVSRLTVVAAQSVGTLADKVGFPVLVRLQDRPAALWGVYLFGLDAVTSVLSPLALFFFVCAPETVTVTLGDQWMSAVEPFKLLILLAPLRGLLRMSDCLARSTGAVYGSAWRKAAYAGEMLLATVIGAQWGMVGACVGVLFAVALNAGAMLRFSVKVAGGEWLSLLKLHCRAFTMALLTLGLSVPAMHFLRKSALPPIGRLSACALITSAGIVAFAATFPAIAPSANQIAKRALGAAMARRRPSESRENGPKWTVN